MNPPRVSKSKQEPVRKKVKDFFDQHRLPEDVGALVVGVSGGPDSVCLLHVLVSLREQLGLKLHAAHLNHQLRGAESEAEAGYVADLARSLDIPAAVARRDVQAYRNSHRCSLEEAAREVRYSFLAEVASSIGSRGVAVGHTLDDKLETVLMHLVRGTGLAGLRGIQPVSRWHSRTSQAQIAIIRPLLEVTREETQAYCADHGLHPRLDSSNLSLSYFRNRIRLELLPRLRSYNPNIAATLKRLAEVAGEELAFFEEQVSKVWDRVVVTHADHLEFNTEALADLPPALQRHVVRRALAEQLGDLRDIEAVHIESLRKILLSSAGKRLSLPGGLVVVIGYGSAVLSRKAAPECPLPTLEREYRLNIPGETALPGWRVTSRILPREPSPRAENPYQAFFDFDVVGSDLMVRKRRPGDRFQPLGMAELKKLQDFMVDSKIPRGFRDRVPLVVSPEHIIWVLGWRIDERAKVSESTKRALALEFETV